MAELDEMDMADAALEKAAGDGEQYRKEPIERTLDSYLRKYHRVMY
ncbi:MAG: hypothetical protein J6Z82_09745 [Schwartzia sp.]|nr:hypothetical protein [Schwartzia sp. (in: firmicutes)]